MAVNLGVQREFISGLSGVAPGAQATLNVPVGRRWHSINLRCLAVYYTAPVITVAASALTPSVAPTFGFTVTAGVLSAPTITTAGSGLVNGVYGANVVDLAGTGTGATVKVTVAGNVVSAVAIGAGGVGYSAAAATAAGNNVPLPQAAIGTLPTFTGNITNGAFILGAGGVTVVNTGSNLVTGTFPLVITDPTGIGATGTYTAAGGVVTAATITSIGTQGPIPPGVLLGIVKIQVNTVNVRDIPASTIVAMQIANGYIPQPGELLLAFTEPWNSKLEHYDFSSWDTFGQNNMQITFSIAANVTNPQLAGTWCWDTQRNARPASAATAARLNGIGPNPATGQKWQQGDAVPFLNPINHHQLNWQLGVGRNDINILPYSYPIRRIWVFGATPGNLYQMEVYADGFKVVEGLTLDFYNFYSDWNFQIGTTALPVAGGAPQFFPSTIPNGRLAQVNQVPQYPFDCALIMDVKGDYWKSLKVSSNLLVRVYSNIQQQSTYVMEMLPGAYSA